MSMATLSWQDFLKEATEFQNIAERLGDIWTLHKKNDEEGYAYLTYEQLLPNTIDTKAVIDPLEDGSCDDLPGANAPLTQTTNELLKYEYHIVYSMSYQVPVLYFRIYRSDGSMVSLEDAWRLFRFHNNKSGVGTKAHRNEAEADMFSILTQMEHPILLKPYNALHPCRTAELLAQAGVSRNRILTFISLMGPYVQLVLRNEYGVPYADT